MAPVRAPRAAAALGALAAVALMGVASLVSAPTALAHGALRASDPADRAVLQEPPATVTLSFTEAPEARLSSVQVLDGSGASFGAGDLQPVDGDPESLRLGLRPLARGVYTVNWRIVSRVDGHLTAGTIVFGFQEPVSSMPPPAPGSPVGTLSNRSPGTLGGRVLLYTGLAAMLGGAWTGLALFGGNRRGDLLALATAGWVVAVVGVAAIGLAQQASTGVSVGVFLETRLGRGLLWRGAGLAVAGVGLVLARGGGRGRWRGGSGLVVVGFVGVVVAHVEAGHAAAGSWPWVMVGLQVAHVVAMASWIGGLAAILLVLRRRPAAAPDGDDGADDGAVLAAARRFSAVAVVAVATLVVTGGLRAIDAVGGWAPLWDSGYGRLVVVKSGLLLVLVGLGARNRYRHVPAAGRSLTGLRRVGVAELAVAAGVLLVTGFLSTSPPPATAQASAPEVVIEASDFGTTVRARLTVSPAQAGENRFTLRLADYDSGEPVVAELVTARFALPAFAGASPSTLDLQATRPGTFVASGANLSLPGRWDVVLVIDRGARSLELPLELLVRAPPSPVTVGRAPANPRSPPRP